MPAPGTVYEAPSWPNIFRQDVAAEVPAIQLTHKEWEAVLFIIKTLGDLVDDLCPKEVATAIIEGKVISEAAHQAWGLKHWLRM